MSQHTVYAKGKDEVLVDVGKRLGDEQRAIGFEGEQRAIRLWGRGSAFLDPNSFAKGMTKFLWKGCRRAKEK